MLRPVPHPFLSHAAPLLCYLVTMNSASVSYHTLPIVSKHSQHSRLLHWGASWLGTSQEKKEVSKAKTDPVLGLRVTGADGVESVMHPCPHPSCLTHWGC